MLNAEIEIALAINYVAVHDQENNQNNTILIDCLSKNKRKNRRNKFPFFKI